MKDRIRRMREQLFTQDDRTVFWERVLALRRAHQKYPHARGACLYALALREITDSMSVVIGENDLIVGWPLEVLLSPTEEGLFAEYKAEYFEPPWFSTRGHITPTWDVLLERGLLGLKREAEDSLATLDREEDGSAERLEFWQAIADCCQAVVDLAGRYAETAALLAKSEPRPARRAELERIAAVCSRVPALPARSFHEAVQSVWFIDFVLHTILGARDYALGRLDQYLYPYYQRDITGGAIDRAGALELLQCLLVKTNESIGLSDHYTAPRKRSLCRDSVQYLIVAGQTRDGRDATNELSFLCLNAIDELRLKEPNLTVRYHAGIDRSFWSQVCDAVRRGASIGIYNDETIVASLVNLGLSVEDAREYVHYGCCNPNLPGQEPWLREYQHSLAKCLELALNNGRDPYPVKPRRLHTELSMHSAAFPVEEVFAGPATGEPEELRTFADLMRAVKTQIAHDVERVVALKRAFYEKDYLANRPFSFESALIHDCLARGKDLNHGGARYVHHNDYAGGLATVADSLAAIKQGLYDEGWLTWEELRRALASNFEGQEELRLRLLNRCPKFGNDEDSVDAIAREIGECFCQEVLKHRDPVVGVCWPGIYTYHRYKAIGLLAGATPDGRLAGTPVSENQGPAAGGGRLGPTAMLRSMAKLPLHLTPGGGNTMMLHPSLVSGPAGAKHLSDLLETFFRLGGQHQQINVIDAETLRAAQREPARYRGLVVRVTGYSAYFVTLDRQTQDILIAAADNGLG